ncbi:hypothetical protein B0H13DRAFT_1011490 [Mycena leptocephala]|nr:hypothetical protein B0H13DRAFT_1011490 [Mycena leptocephala]
MGSLDSRARGVVGVLVLTLSFGAGLSFFHSFFFFHLSVYSFTCFGFALGLVLVIALTACMYRRAYRQAWLLGSLASHSFLYIKSVRPRLWLPGSIARTHEWMVDAYVL